MELIIEELTEMDRSGKHTSLIGSGNEMSQQQTATNPTLSRIVINTTHMGQEPTTMADTLSQGIDTATESMMTTPFEGSKEFSIELDLRNASGLRLKGILKETYTYAQIKELKESDAEKIYLAKMIQQLIEFLGEKLESISKITIDPKKLQQLTSAITEVSAKKLQLEQYKSKITKIVQQIKEKQVQYQQTIQTLKNNLPKVKNEIKKAMSVALNELKLSVGDDELDTVIGQKIDHAIASIEQDPSVAAENLTLDALGQSIATGVVEKAKNRPEDSPKAPSKAIQLWNKVHTEIKTVQVITAFQQATPEAITQKHEIIDLKAGAKALVEKTKAVMGETKEALETLDNLLSELDNPKSLGLSNGPS